MAILIDGKLVSQKIREEEAREAEEFYKKYGRKPGLGVIIVGDDAASKIYVRNKRLACEKAGFYSSTLELPSDISEEELKARIRELNICPSVDGILVQLPLPPHIDEKKIISEIDPDKDADAFHPLNVGKMFKGADGFSPCTPRGIIELLKFYGISIEGKNCVVVGRSNIVGKPLSMLLLKENATVTICHSKTRNLAEICRGAEILVSAVGKPFFIKSDMVRKDAVVIDVGMNRLGDGRLVGDVDFENVKNIASYITPVPGGVGPMTITMLLSNTLKAAYLHEKERHSK